MGLLEMIFKRPQALQKARGYFQMLDGYRPVYSSWRGGLYEMQQTASIINTISTDCGKAVPELSGHSKKLEYMLKHRPNPWMNTSDFIERVVTCYLCDNNAFILPILDEYDRVVGLFPTKASSCQTLDVNGELYLRFEFPNRQVGVIEYSRVGHIKRMLYDNDLFGTPNIAMNQTLSILHAQNESVENALKESGFIRFMAKIREQLLDEEAFKNQRDMFSKINFGSDNRQMLLYDSRYEEIKQVDSKPVYLDDKQQSLISTNINNYFGVSDKVVQHSFKDDYEWSAYFEGVIEPILIKIEHEITKMLYTDQQIIAGNGVYMTTNRLQYMTNQSKLEFSTQMFDRGVISGNDVCDIWNLAHYGDEGDKHYIRREYIDVQLLDRDLIDDDSESEDENNDQDNS